MNDVKVDWPKAPEGATDYNSVNEMWYKEDTEGMMSFNNDDGRWLGVSGKRKAYNYGDGTSCLIPRPKEDDLQLEIKPKYSSLQELPVGTFVKFRGEHFPIYVWGGNQKGLLSLDQTNRHFSFKDQVVNYKGFKYKYNSDNDIISYSDKYDGEYISVAEEQPKPAQVAPQAIKDGWKIKHIKHSDYKCGRDVAVTILYRDVLIFDVGCAEYKYSICNPKDMFDRKLGVQIAYGKEYRTIMGRDDLFRKILCDIFASKENVSPQFEELFNWYCNNH